MFPTKNKMDYMPDINLLFPKAENDLDLLPHTFSSPFQTRNPNKSSSSTDSISPESGYDLPFKFSQSTELLNLTRSVTPFETPTDIRPFSTNKTPLSVFESMFTIFDDNNSSQDINTFNFDSNFPVYESQIYDCNQSSTPSHIGHQRPIKGRKILGRSAQSSTKEPINVNSDLVNSVWQSKTILAPEKIERTYELFPSNDRSFESFTPMQNISTVTQKYISPPTLSPTTCRSPSALLYQSQSPTFLPTYSNRKPVPNPVSNITNPFNPGTFAQASSSQDDIAQSKMCTFCRKNGETPTVYMTHQVKEKVKNNKYIVTCPILRAHICSICGASGDNAHTITYCPAQRSINRGKPPLSTTIILKNTRLKSNGVRRF